MAVNLVHIHHEGGGSPSDNVDRFSEGGYCYGIGTTLWKRFRSPADNWATLNYNGEDLTICLSGNRMDYPVTDSDLNLIHGAFMDCYNRGEVTADPDVVAHRNAGRGNATACPGDRTMDRWNDVVATCHYSTAPPPTPTPTEAPLTCIAFGPNQSNGRTPTARPDIQNGVVLLENGARVKDDKAGPNAGPETRRTWRHPKVQSDAKLVDIAARDSCFVALYKQSDGRIVTFQAQLP